MILARCLVKIKFAALIYLQLVIIPIHFVTESLKHFVMRMLTRASCASLDRDGFIDVPTPTGIYIPFDGSTHFSWLFGCQVVHCFCITLNSFGFLNLNFTSVLLRLMYNFFYSHPPLSWDENICIMTRFLYNF